MTGRAHDTGAADAWSAFWSSAEGRQHGCLPDGKQNLKDNLRAVWHRFASILPTGSGVLDLATGDAVVLRWIAERRGDLRLVGVDLADPLPEPPPGIATQAGVDLAHLPFPDASFAAVTSQFGIEYAELAPAMAEAARVLRTGGRAVLVTHRGESPVLAHNRVRAEALDWAIAKLKLPNLPSRIETLGGEATSRFGMTSPAWEIFEALRRTSGGGGKAGMAALSTELARLAGHERSRIEALANAARCADDEDQWQAAASAAGLVQSEKIDLRETPQADPFARLRVFIRD